jgi:hypothetical protein
MPGDDASGYEPNAYENAFRNTLEIFGDIDGKKSQVMETSSWETMMQLAPESDKRQQDLYLAYMKAVDCSATLAANAKLRKAGVNTIGEAVEYKQMMRLHWAHAAKTKGEGSPEYTQTMNIGWAAAAEAGAAEAMAVGPLSFPAPSQGTGETKSP